MFVRKEKYGDEYILLHNQFLLGSFRAEKMEISTVKTKAN